MKKKILLIDPFYNNGALPPNYSLGEIERDLFNYFDISVSDFVRKEEYMALELFNRDEEQYIRGICNEVMEKNPEYVYITTSYGIPIKQKPVIPRVIKIVNDIRKINFKGEIYIGGMAINVIFKEIKNITHNIIEGAKIVVGDECEFSKMICRRYNKKYDNCKIIKWENWNLDKYPNYLSFLTAKGCPSKCNFCMENKVYDGEYKRYDIDIVYENILYFYNKGYRKFAIEDSSFMFNNDYVQFCQNIISDKLDIKWTCYAKTCQIVNNKNVELLKKAGCSSVIIGIETLDNMILKKLQKGIIYDDTKKALDCLKKAGILVQGCFMLGLKDQTADSIIANIEHANSLDLYSYRWHIFQKNICELVSGDIEVGTKKYMQLQLNIPDECLDEYIKEVQELPLYLNEEHFLVRCLGYVKNSDVFAKYSIANVTYKFLFDEMKKRVRNKVFDEEKMYELI